MWVPAWIGNAARGVRAAQHPGLIRDFAVTIVVIQSTTALGLDETAVEDPSFLIEA